MTAPPGVIVDASVTGDAIEAALQYWLPAYLAHLGRLDRDRRGNAGLAADTVATPKSWHQTSDPIEEAGVRWPNHLLPAIYVVYDQLADTPVRDGDGKYSVRRRFEVAAVVQADTQANANRLSQIYEMAIVAVLTQANPSLDGHASGVAWLPGTAANRIPASEQRHLAGCGAVFVIDVPDVIDVFDGLAEPMPGTPPGEAPDRPTFESHQITVDPKEAE